MAKQKKGGGAEAYHEMYKFFTQAVDDGGSSSLSQSSADTACRATWPTG